MALSVIISSIIVEVRWWDPYWTS